MKNPKSETAGESRSGTETETVPVTRKRAARKSATAATKKTATPAATAKRAVAKKSARRKPEDAPADTQLLLPVDTDPAPEAPAAPTPAAKRKSATRKQPARRTAAARTQEPPPAPDPEPAPPAVDPAPAASSSNGAAPAAERAPSPRDSDVPAAAESENPPPPADPGPQEHDSYRDTDGQPRRLTKWERWKQRKEKYKLMKQQRYLERQAAHGGPAVRDQRTANGGPPSEGAPGRERPPRPEPVLGPPEPCSGLLEISGKGFAFLRPRERDYEASPSDPFVSPDLVRTCGLREGVFVEGVMRRGGRGQQLTEITSVNGRPPEAYRSLPLFEELTAINPNKRFLLETTPSRHTTRLIDFISPIGRGQRGLIVAAPRAGKTTFLQHIAEAILENYDDVKVIVLLVDERPEEVTEIARALPGAEIMASSNDQEPRDHIRMAHLAVERAKRLVEAGEHVFMVLDSITRLARAFNNATRGGGKAMSGGVDSRALEGPRRLFASARNTREGGSLTIVATALVETNNKGDELIFQEFKGTGNMELVLDRRIAQQYVYPAVDIFKSGTRREELLLPPHQLEKVHLIRRGLAGHKPVEAVERLLHFMNRFPSNAQMLLEIKARE